MKEIVDHGAGEAASVLCRDPKRRRSVAANTPCVTPSRTASSQSQFLYHWRNGTTGDSSRYRAHRSGYDKADDAA